jgi:hypothetical protein
MVLKRAGIDLVDDGAAPPVLVDCGGFDRLGLGHDEAVCHGHLLSLGFPGRAKDDRMGT